MSYPQAKFRLGGEPFVPKSNYSGHTYHVQLYLHKVAPPPFLLLQ